MDQKIIAIARRYANKVKAHLPVEMIILFGSHVRGTAGKNSDIDLAVVVNQLNADYLQVSAELFDMVRDINKRIEPVLLCRSHDASGFLESIMRNGKIIYQATNNV